MNLKIKFYSTRLVIALLVLLFPSLSSAQTGVGSTGIILEKVLEKNERAPFEGVLVPYPQYYYYQEQVEINFAHEVQPPECDSCFHAMGAGFLSGVAGSLLLVLLVSTSR